MDAEVRRLDSMGQKSIIMKTMKLFVEHDTEAESYTNCIEVENTTCGHVDKPCFLCFLRLRAISISIW